MKDVIRFSIGDVWEYASPIDLFVLLVVGPRYKRIGEFGDRKVVDCLVLDSVNDDPDETPLGSVRVFYATRDPLRDVYDSRGVWRKLT